MLILFYYTSLASVGLGGAYMNSNPLVGVCLFALGTVPLGFLFAFLERRSRCQG